MAPIIEYSFHLKKTNKTELKHYIQYCDVQLLLMVLIWYIQEISEQESDTVFGPLRSIPTRDSSYQFYLRLIYCYTDSAFYSVVL